MFFMNFNTLDLILDINFVFVKCIETEFNLHI